MRTRGKLNMVAGLATLTLLRMSPTALAQESDLQGFRAACEQDYRRYCVGDDPGAALEAACLSQYYINLSLSCRAALDRQQNPGAAEDQSGSSEENSP